MAILLLEDGRRFDGAPFGATGVSVGEIVFNTAMTGYQEVLTDPSYTEQVVVMTYPHIGNTGVNSVDVESNGVSVAGFVAREFSDFSSNYRSEGTLDDYLKKNGIVALQDIDTRALVRHLRTAGAMKCAICTDETPEEELVARMAAWPGMEGRALANEVSRDQVAVVNDPPEPTVRVAVVDCGIKTNILRLFIERGAYVRVHPLSDTAEDWSKDVDGVFFSNGPGDPSALPVAIEKIKSLIGKVPLTGICLGHQLLTLGLGAKTYKLKFGHRGANHPVRDERDGVVAITSQNHGFAVDEESLIATGAVVTHRNLNDDTVSGFTHAAHNIMGVQYHPEACPGPHDSANVIDEFILRMRGDTGGGE